MRNSVEEIRWRAIAENPLSPNLLTLTQFLQQCSHTPHLINDIVFNGTFATMEDYVECAKIINQLPNLRRFAMVSAQPMIIQLRQNVFWQVTDIAFRSCRLRSLPLFLSGIHNLNSVDVSSNYLTNLDVVERLNLERVEMMNISKNSFTVMPNAVSRMHSVIKIDASYNAIGQLDGELFRELYRLREIDLTNNSEITQLPAELVLLPSLNRLTLTGLFTLKKPPYSVAKQGLEHLRKYYEIKNRTGWLHSTATSAIRKKR